MGLIFQKESFKSIFLQQWSRYVPAIIQYAEQSPRKSVKRKITLEGQCTVNHLEPQSSQRCQENGKSMVYSCFCLLRYLEDKG